MNNTTTQSQEYRTHNMILTIHPSPPNWLHTRVENKDWDQWKFITVNQEETQILLKKINKINKFNAVFA